MKVIALTGMSGSGKEEFVLQAKEKGIPVVRMGDVVRNEVSKQKPELTDDNVGKTANNEREKYGFGIWAKRTVPLVKGDFVIIDGVRGDAELSVFRKTFGDDLIVVGVHSSPKTRYERIKKRNRKDATTTWEDFHKRDLRELSWGIGNAIALCDLMIVNEGSLAHFKKEVKKILDILK